MFFGSIFDKFSKKKEYVTKNKVNLPDEQLDRIYLEITHLFVKQFFNQMEGTIKEFEKRFGNDSERVKAVLYMNIITHILGNYLRMLDEKYTEEAKKQIFENVDIMLRTKSDDLG